MKKWIILAILIKLVFIGITYHPDTHFFILANYITIIKGGWLNFYDFLGNDPDPVASVLPAYAFTYPPLAILTNGLSALPFYPLIGSSFISQFLLNPESVMNQTSYFLLMYATKIGYLIPDFLIAFILLKILPGKKGNLAAIVWLLNPITLYSTYGIGAFDLYPVLAVVYAYYLYLNKHSTLASIVLGIGGAFKLFPLLFLPILIFNNKSTFQDKAIKISAGISGYLLPIIPYLLTSPGFRHYALLAPQTDKMLFAKIPVSGAEYLSIFFLVLALIIAVASAQNQIFAGWTSILLTFFAVTHYHPQWMVWLVPFAIISITKIPQLKYHYLFLSLCYFVIILSFDSSLNYGLFLPFHNQPSIISLIPPALEVTKYLSIVRSVAAGISLYIIYQLFSQAPNDHKS